MTGPERHREPRTERRERPHAGSAFGNGVMRSARIAGMTGVNLVSVRPDEFSIDVEPDEIGCED